MINRDRMTDTVLDLLRLDSQSKAEKPVAEYLVRCLVDLGCDVRVDNAGAGVRSNSGNVIAKVGATASSAPPLLLSAHMDVVPPGEGVKPVREPERVRSDGTTILGGDDKTGLAVILEVLRALRDAQTPHGPLEIAFTICEEIGLLGAKALEFDQFHAREAIVLDSCNATELVTRAPSADRYVFTVHGLEAHAGMFPENGISAVRVAAEAIAAMPLGRIDAGTTANVVIADGPTATNVVPNLCVVRGEARAIDEARLDEIMRLTRACFTDAAARAKIDLNGQVRRAWVEEQSSRDYHSFAIPDSAPIVQLVCGAARRQGTTVKTVTIGGGSDANVFNRHGIASVNLGTGMRDIHTVNEWIDLADFDRCAQIVLACVKERAAA
ncbi:MAG TPA: M20/M25/M40 family metallo-hydrolase [Candidatus Acidoferrales bacterium]|nr:M20/M25/M40 family metallo-hydrolase [Candidatus Acidoferrales bacterium]